MCILDVWFSTRNYFSVEQIMEEASYESIQNRLEQAQICSSTFCKNMVEVSSFTGLQNPLRTNSSFPKKILSNDELIFGIKGKLIKINCRIWSDYNSQAIVVTPLNSTIWSIFIKNKADHNIIINGECYGTLTNAFLVSELKRADYRQALVPKRHVIHPRKTSTYLKKLLVSALFQAVDLWSVLQDP